MKLRLFVLAGLVAVSSQQSARADMKATPKVDKVEPPKTPPRTMTLPAFMKKPVTIARPNLSATERTAVQNALAASKPKYQASGRELDLFEGMMNLSPDQQRLYRSDAMTLIAERTRPDLVQGWVVKPGNLPPRYFFESAQLVGFWQESQCFATFVLDVVLKNRGYAPTSDTGYDYWDNTGGWFNGGRIDLPRLAPNASASVTLQVKLRLPGREVPNQQGDGFERKCDPLTGNTTYELGGGAFYNAGIGRHVMWLENGTFFIVDVSGA